MKSACYKLSIIKIKKAQLSLTNPRDAG